MNPSLYGWKPIEREISDRWYLQLTVQILSYHIADADYRFCQLVFNGHSNPHSSRVLHAWEPL